MFEFKIWRDGHTANDTLIVFIPGFLTQESVKNNETWSNQLLLYAAEKNYSIGSVFWPSSTPKDLLDINTLSVSSLSQNFITKWHDADQHTGEIVNNLVEMSLYFKKKKTILVGHSLGAKIALQTIEQSPQNTFHSVVAMAAACLPTSCDFGKIRQKTKRKPMILFSKKDKVLEYLYPTAQNKKNILNISESAKTTTSLLLSIGAHYLMNRNTNSALGFSGVASSDVTNIDTCKLLNKEIGHLAYEHVCKDILHSLKI